MERIVKDNVHIDKLEGIDLKLWRRKLLFIFHTLDIAYVVDKEPPVVDVTASDDDRKNQQESLDKYNKANFIAREMILNNLSKRLFQVFEDINSAKELWELLDKRYSGTLNVQISTLYSKFNSFQMDENKSISENLEELEIHLSQLKIVGEAPSLQSQISTVIRSLPNSWNEAKVRLSHITFESLESLGNYLKIEENSRDLIGVTTSSK
ncbi:uncharacterized protein LOC143855794 [Tasmannia lanceolata]|uniref:uncharacterized protein LOC143855794 n=1 Tax=Tasmannia lanceolata TaxID=3420 RepID=UPI0040633052